MIALSFESAVAAISAPPSTVTISLAWNAVPESNIRGYRVFVGTVGNQYSRQYDTGKVTTFPVGDLVSGQTYYFAIKAIGSTGVEGERSDELVVPVTSQPTAEDDSYSTIGDTQLVVPADGVLSNDTDMDSYTLTAVLISGPAHGTLLLGQYGGFTYTPFAGFTGIDSFVYHASDGLYDSEAAIVEVVVKKPTFQLLANGSFESNYTGWNVTGNHRIESASPYVPTDGARLVAFNARDLTPNGVISQSFATVIGETYTLTFDAGLLAYNTSTQRLLVNVMGKINRFSQTYTTNGNSSGNNIWISHSLTFVADSTSTNLSFEDNSPVSSSIDLLLDNVSVTGPKVSEDYPTLAESAGTPSLAGRPGAVTVGMSVSETGSYVLERSVDLVNWEVVETTQVTQPGRIEFLDSKPASANEPRIFYRIGRR